MRRCGGNCPVAARAAGFTSKDLDRRSALAAHLFRAYGDGVKRVPPVIGGLGARRPRHVVDYVEAHLTDDISLPDLAALVGLSPDHFGDAFKASSGTPPHHYLIERRIPGVRNGC